MPEEHKYTRRAGALTVHTVPIPVTRDYGFAAGQHISYPHDTGTSNDPHTTYAGTIIYVHPKNRFLTIQRKSKSGLPVRDTVNRHQWREIKRLI